MTTRQWFRQLRAHDVLHDDLWHDRWVLACTIERLADVYTFPTVTEITTDAYGARRWHRYDPRPELRLVLEREAAETLVRILRHAGLYTLEALRRKQREDQIRDAMNDGMLRRQFGGW